MSFETSHTNWFFHWFVIFIIDKETISDYSLLFSDKTLISFKRTLLTMRIRNILRLTCDRVSWQGTTARISQSRRSESWLLTCWVFLFRRTGRKFRPPFFRRVYLFATRERRLSRRLFYFISALLSLSLSWVHRRISYIKVEYILSSF